MIPYGIIQGDGAWQYDVFTPIDTSGVRAHMWRKPAGCSLIYAFLVAGGGGGGGGRTGAAASARGGGGGGGIGGTMSALVPANLVPEYFYVIPGAGGTGGAANTAGNGGATSVISIRPDTPSGTVGNLFPTPQVGLGGGAGLTTAGGTAGSASGGTNVTSMHSIMSIVNGVGGGVGLAGGVHTGAVGGGTTQSALIGPGCGGGGTTSADFDGGIPVPTIFSIGGVRGFMTAANAAAPDGQNGHGFNTRFDPLNIRRLATTSIISTGGGGGAARNSLVGGNGGNGGWGSGGGGGGGGTTGGTGGKGGDGLIIIGWM